jgi:hypothetical protein
MIARQVDEVALRAGKDHFDPALATEMPAFKIRSITLRTGHHKKLFR